MSHPAVAESRRSLLRNVFVGVFAGVVAAPLAACDLLDSDPPPPPSPDQLTDFYNETAALIERYDAEITTNPALVTIRDAHKAHLAALAAIMKPVPSSPAVASPPPGDLRQAELRAQQSAVQACMTAAPSRATLLGEIAAARACHL